MPKLLSELPLSLYIHFPWCVKKCPYCDFNSHALRGALSDDTLPEAAYIDALIRDLDFELAQDAAPRPLVSLFMGGGTPSLFSGKAIGRLLEAINARLSFVDDIEITLEANPGTVDEAHFADYRAAGVNRLSIGVQSLNEKHLQALGRIHDRGQAVHALEAARRVGFDNINLDLMYALPQQSRGEAEADIRALCGLAPEHISYYQLTLEPNTEFYARPPPLPDDEAAWSMQEQGQGLLAEHGYRQYEVSAYAQAGRRSRHNLNYWQYGDYLGIGAGAHGKLTRGASIIRRAKHKHPKTYLDAAGTPAALQETKPVEIQDLPFEFAMNALRLNEGFDLAEFTRRTGLAADVLARPLQQARERGLVEIDGNLVRPSARGRTYLNDLVGLFLP